MTNPSDLTRERVANARARCTADDEELALRLSRLRYAAIRFLERIDGITTHAFANGYDKPEREEIRKAIKDLEPYDLASLFQLAAAACRQETRK